MGNSNEQQNKQNDNKPQITIKRPFNSRLLLITICIVGVVILSFSMKQCGPAFSIEGNDKITQTPNIVTEIEKRGKWEFLSVELEELVDTVRGRVFKDKLSVIYVGKLRYGIDFTKIEDDWFTTKGDTVFACLPKVTLLDEYFLNEAATKSVFNTGSFTPQDRQDLRNRAISRMLEKSKANGYCETAQENAQIQIANFLNQLGVKNIVFLDRP